MIVNILGRLMGNLANPALYRHIKTARIQPLGFGTIVIVNWVSSSSDMLMPNVSNVLNINAFARLVKVHVQVA